MGLTSARGRVVPLLGSPRLAALAARAIALSLVLYVVLRPENYSLTPNPLDPVFYTGYATNLDDLLSGVGQHHYFLTRWSHYLPAYVLSQIVGPIVGRLLLRLLVTATILTVVWRFGRRWNWTVAQELLIGTVLVTMPMFVRAFLTDYSEWAVVAYGILLLLLCLRTRQTRWSVVAIGVLAGLLAVANPATVTIAAAPLAAAVWFGADTRRGRLAIIGGISATAIATMFAGFLLFRWHYGIPNVYAPTASFLRHPPGPDPLRSPRLEWLWQFTWLYGPPVAMVAYLGVARLRRVRLQRVERIALAICGAQYVYQWLDQFVRKGDGLEISYYWSFMYPAFGVVVAIGLGRATAGQRARVLLAITAAWVALLALGVPDALRLPDGALMFLVVAVVLAAAIAVARHSLTATVAVTLALVAWLQLGAPEYDPSAYHPYNTSPRYDLLYRRAGDTSERTLTEVVWFEQRMDTVPFDQYASFVPLVPEAGYITGVYAPHIIGRLLDPASPPDLLSTQAAASIPDDVPVTIALYGPPAAVAGAAAAFLADSTAWTMQLDATHGGGLGFRLMVFVAPAGR